MKIIGTGLSGLVGSRVVELLSPSYSFENLSLETGVDITQKETVDAYLDRSDSPWVFHFAAKTDVDGAEKERNLGEKGSVWLVNVGATQYIVDACRRTKKRLLYISTDFVFDGKKDVYNEDDIPKPQGWYAVTKYEGEKRVTSLDNGLVIRIAYPYRASDKVRPDFVNKIIARLKSGESIAAPGDKLFGPTFIDDIAHAIQVLVERNARGIYHVVGSEAISPYRAAQQIAT